MFICPWVLVAAWSWPYLEHSAFSKWVVINTVFAFFIFFVTAGISHLILRFLKLSKGWHYVLIMFCVCLVLYFTFSVYSSIGYSELYHSQTQVVTDGKITAAGYILKLKNSLLGSLLSAGVFYLFWLIAVWRPSSHEQKT